MTKIEEFWKYENSKMLCKTFEYVHFQGWGKLLVNMVQFLATGNPLKIMKNAFYFTSNTFSFCKISKWLPWLLAHVWKRFDYKKKVNFKIYDVTTLLTNGFNKRITQYLKK